MQIFLHEPHAQTSAPQIVLHCARAGQFLQIARARDNFSKIARVRATLGRNCALEISGAQYKLSSLEIVCLMTFNSYLAHSEPIFKGLKILDIYKINDYLISLFMFRYHYAKNLPEVFTDYFDQ